MKSATDRKTVVSTLDAIKKRAPAYTELADKFGPLFLEQARLSEECAAEGLALPEIDPARANQGVPILVDTDLSPWAESLKKSAAAMLPLLFDVLGLEKEAWEKLERFMDDSDGIAGLAQARIEGNWKHFESTSVQLGITPYTTLLYISEAVFSPVLRALAAGLGEPLSKMGWDEGYCPVCGATPSIAQLSPREVTELDQLVGGGGKKFLHCSLCGHDWRYKRNACPACGNDENESREVFYQDKAKFERIEACHKCGKYCLSIDMRECEPLPDLDVAQIGLIHLDMFAREHDLSPISSTLWNSLE
ncbi:formate dehydrogenase accessory protein FdhE [uncultured Pseudodesulfovibrio sp.]|uniref:formate dehydrogenase accessory protein FdhE n=1 Tax=uncultured Pseudodesulfovibrio sp. TaxID=2035858 RepID=UPI0029C6450E|nr:formate dehydrogenase accessory protein FdhE [uncultured Pseudodesulfovibrio sp.]